MTPNPCRMQPTNAGRAAVVAPEPASTGQSEEASVCKSRWQLMRESLGGGSQHSSCYR